MRPSWDNFFLSQLPALAGRATCDRGRCATIVVRDNEQLAAGYVGSPSGFPHCDDDGHQWDPSGKHCIRTIHAEQNAIIRAARNGISLRDSTVYTTMVPCYICAKLLIGIGVYRVVAAHPYHAMQPSEDAFFDAGILLTIRSKDALYVP